LTSGTPNTKLSISYLRHGTKSELKRQLTRQTISIPNVPYYGTIDEDEKIGYILLTSFSLGAAREVKDALQSLKKKYDIESLILDLRSNPGGLLHEAVELVNLFIPTGYEVVSTRGRVTQWDNVYMTRHAPVDTLIPLAVVVNRMSASASEIVAGAIQDLDRGVVVGQRTFGKGLVQTTRQLTYNAQLKITTSKYYIPSGRCIQAVNPAQDGGTSKNIADSLTREFKTLKTKRIVRDGGGVKPDVEVPSQTISRIAASLYLNNLIFNYASQYVHNRDTIAKAKYFRLTDVEYADFVNYLQDKRFDYQNQTEIAFQNLLESATNEKYIDIAHAEFAALKAKISHNPQQDLIVFKSEIKELLEEEIASRFYYSAGRVAVTIRDDSQIRTAAKLLSEPQLYAKTLNKL
jgi:carboxyl-terminal processing protease